MKRLMVSALKAAIRGLLIIIPVYLAVLLLLKGMQSVGKLVRPFVHLLPQWVPAEELMSLLLFLAICIVVGVSVSTRLGKRARNRLEATVFERIPGYALIRSLTHQVAGHTGESGWKPALFESDEGLVPAFIIEKLEDGRYTVFVPSIPTPFAGAVYVLDAWRVHALDLPFTDAFRVVSRLASGAKDLVAAMTKGRRE